MSDLVSIYVPTRDRAALVERAVRSALAQRYRPIEVVVVDDGSSDETPRRLAELVAAEPTRLRVLRNETPEGASAARNRAIREARGRFVTGLDDDDELLPDHVERLCDAYRDEFAFVCSSRLEVVGERRVPNRLDAGPITLDDLLHYNKVGNQVLALRERVLAAGGFDESLPAFQDYDLWVRLLAARGGCALKTRDATYVVHLDHALGRISDSSERKLAGLTRFVERHGGRMQASHRASMELLRRKIAGDPISFPALLRLARPGNLKSIASLYLNARVPAVQKFYHAMRSRIG